MINKLKINKSILSRFILLKVFLLHAIVIAGVGNNIKLIGI